VELINKNKEITKNSFTEEEFKNGAFSNQDGLCTRILTKPLIDIITPIIDFSKVEVILDIGSRDGCQSLEFNRWFPNAKVYTFEPVKSSFDYTANNVKNIKNIEVYNYACNNSKGATKFYEVYNGNIGASSLLKTTNHHRSRSWLQKEVEVDSIVLSEWLQEKNIKKIDIAWVDVQGAEKIVFESFGKYLNSIQVINTEVGNVPLYEGAIIKPELDLILSDFKCISSTLVGGNTEVDAIYVNKNI